MDDRSMEERSVEERWLEEVSPHAHEVPLEDDEASARAAEAEEPVATRTTSRLGRPGSTAGQG